MQLFKAKKKETKKKSVKKQQVVTAAYLCFFFFCFKLQTMVFKIHTFFVCSENQDGL